MREKFIECKLVSAVEKRGGMCPKLVCPGINGMPDRLVLIPGGKIAFVEVKAPGKKPRLLQELRHKQLKELGFTVYVLDGIEKIGEMLNEIHSA